jgi:hypothetical protein
VPHLWVFALGYGGGDEDRFVVMIPPTGLPSTKTSGSGTFRLDLTLGKYVIQSKRLETGPMGDFIREQTSGGATVLIIDLQEGATVDVGRVRVRKK